MNIYIASEKEFIDMWCVPFFMSLVKTLFPTLKNINNDAIIPHWNNEDTPWDLISKNNDNNLISQINEMNNNLEILDIKNYLDVRFDQSCGKIYIHPSAKIGQFVRIEGPCFIGKNCEIRHGAYIRGGSWISEEAIVGHSSEIKNSLFLPGAKAPHFNYVGDSILGCNVNIGAGVKLSNVRVDRRNIIIKKIDGSKVDSEMNKLGAIIGDGVQIGCNAVTNPGTIIMAHTKINPNKNVS